MHVDIIGNELFGGEEFAKCLVVTAVIGGEDAEVKVGEAERGSRA